ncbi:MAG: COG4315 family predicted lipoprotein [Chloroflexota bacterium]
MRMLSPLTGNRPLIPILALTLALAGCGGSVASTTVSGSVAATTAAATTTAAAPTTTAGLVSSTTAATTASAALTSSASAAAGATAVLVKTDPKLGQLLTDPTGRTLYWYTKYTAGVSNCSGGCLTAWPTFTGSGTPTLPTGVPGKLSTITRSDGSTQIAYDDMPLYHYAKDANPGDITGQNVGKVWFVVPPTAGPLTPPPAA